MIEKSPPASAPVNRYAVISMTMAVFTLLSFCTAIAPVPLTGYICYPAAAVLGLIALISGMLALVQIRATRENGRTYALTGILIGGLAVVASACAIAIGILLFPKVLALIQQYVK